MGIKTPKGVLVNCDHVIAFSYQEKTDCMCMTGTDGISVAFCHGDATGVIIDAIQRDQTYLEVNDCEQ